MTVGIQFIKKVWGIQKKKKNNNSWVVPFQMWVEQVRGNTIVECEYSLRYEVIGTCRTTRTVAILSYVGD